MVGPFPFDLFEMFLIQPIRFGDHPLVEPIVPRLAAAN
jgi:hypothetical protein